MMAKEYATFHPTPREAWRLRALARVREFEKNG